MRQSSSVAFVLRYALQLGLVALVSASSLAFAGQEPAAPPQTEPAAADAPAPTAPAGGERSALDSVTMPLLQFSDPLGRFGFTAPAQWGQLAGSSHDEVTFQSDTGDNIRVSIEPLKVDPKAFQSAYVDTYLKVLDQSFDQVKFVGARPVQLSGRDATDYVFSATYGNSPVVCHQVVLIGTKEVLYITFAGFGLGRLASEQLFQTALLSFWVSPGFGGALTAGLADPNAPGFVIAVPEGWIDQGGSDGNSHMFRPRNSRPTSAYISTRVSKLDGKTTFATVDDAFVTAYGDAIKQQHAEGTFEMRSVQRVFLGGQPGVRFDYGYISNFGIRRAVTVLSVKNGYLIGITCDAVEQAYAIYSGAFENLVAAFRFK